MKFGLNHIFSVLVDLSVRVVLLHDTVQEYLSEWVISWYCFSRDLREDPHRLYEEWSQFVNLHGAKICQLRCIRDEYH